MEKYDKIEDIGKGSFGTVAKIKRKSDGRYLVWKELNYGKMSEKEKQMLVSEVNILRDLRHTNIVKYYDRIIDKTNSKIYIIMELCEGGDIAKMIKVCKQKKSNFSEDFIWNILHQILNALNHCHTRTEGKIIHRDLKPGNVFLD
jgi:NIMA (never in mitosis gene a)-related kinase